jgi:ribosome-binding protein aMBF1 (putative translation factor)
MNTKVTTSSDSSLEFNSFKLAIAVLSERVASLPKEDKDDLFELTKILFTTESSEERESAMRAMDEIMEQRPLRVERLEEPTSPNEALQNWLAFISQRIRSARMAAGLNQTELAEKAGLTQSHISRLENGEHSPNQLTIQKIAKALDIPASDLDPSAQ